MAARLSAALRDRLGHEASRDLGELLDAQESIWGERVLSLAVERFDRRLAQELADLRVALVREIHDARVETFKWAFLFWIGQVAATLGLLGFLLRGFGGWK